MDDDDDDDADDALEEQGRREITPETDTDKANMFLQKLQDLTEIFESKNEDYQAMEEKSEKLRKVSTCRLGAGLVVCVIVCVAWEG